MPPTIAIKLDGHPRIYRPGEMLSGLYQWRIDAPAAPARVEVSVLWHTEGKGDEDFAVHFFDAFEPSDAPSEAHRRARFATQLPNSPLSYDGAILKIRWCVRVRLFLKDGRELLAEKEFQLGNIPSVRSRERGLSRSSRAAAEEGTRGGDGDEAAAEGETRRETPAKTADPTERPGAPVIGRAPADSVRPQDGRPLPAEPTTSPPP